MFADKNHIHAIATVLGTLGGFQAQPDWFANIAKTHVWQILMAAVLVFQGGGNLDIVYSVIVAAVFFTIIKVSSYIVIAPINPIVVQKPPVQVTESEAENFFIRRR